MDTDEKKSFQDLFKKLSYDGRRAMKVDFCRRFDLSESSFRQRYYPSGSLEFSEEERAWAEAYVAKRLNKTRQEA